MKIAVLAGDGIGPEIMAQAERVLDALSLDDVHLDHADVGGIAYHNHGHPLPPETLEKAKNSDAILFGAVGDPSCDALERHLRPEQAILGLRKELDLVRQFASGRRVSRLWLIHLHLKPDIAKQIDLMIIRELTADVYFGEPRGLRMTNDGKREGL